MGRRGFGLGIVLLVYCGYANAYIDPGSNLLLIQGLLALLGGIVVFVKNPIEATKAFFRRLRQKDRDDA